LPPFSFLQKGGGSNCSSFSKRGRGLLVFSFSHRGGGAVCTGFFFLLCRGRNMCVFILQRRRRNLRAFFFFTWGSILCVILFLYRQGSLCTHKNLHRPGARNLHLLPSSQGRAFCVFLLPDLKRGGRIIFACFIPPLQRGCNSFYAFPIIPLDMPMLPF